MTALPRMFSTVLIGVIFALGAGNAYAITIQNLVRIKGHERNVLTGMGIVVGLNGTGDESDDSLVAARPYAQLLKNLGNPVINVQELAEANAYAIVEVTMEIPATGVREGDRLDVFINTLFNAESLQGGRLVVSMLRPPGPDSPDNAPLAYANGPITIEGDNPRSGVVHNGGQMLADIRTNPVTANGTITLVLKDQYAGYPVATTIAGAVNGEFVLDGYPDVAYVEDAKNVKVKVPEADRARPAQFLAAMMTIPIDPSMIRTEARIVVNEKRGIILVTGDVMVGPVAITHEGLSITSITPEPQPTPDEPQVEETRWAELDTTNTQGRTATRLDRLLQAFEQLNVSVSDQIAIIRELKKTGALHAEIVSE